MNHFVMSYLCYKDNYNEVLLLFFRHFVEKGTQCIHQVSFFYSSDCWNTYYQGHYIQI